MYRLMLRLSQGMAYIGGLVLAAMVLMVSCSIIGRMLGTAAHGESLPQILPMLADWIKAHKISAITGAYEILEVGIAFAIFAFLPLCQITGAHATVDIFTNRLPAGALRFLRAIIEILFAAVLVLIAMRLFAGLAAKMRYNETSFMLQFPVWWGYAAALVPAVLAAIVGIYTALIRLAELRRGEDILPQDTEAEH